MRIDATRKRQTILSIENLFRALSLNIGSEPGDFSILDRNIEAIDRGPVRADQGGIFDPDIEKFFHARLPLLSCGFFTLLLLAGAFLCQLDVTPDDLANG